MIYRLESSLSMRVKFMLLRIDEWVENIERMYSMKMYFGSFMFLSVLPLQRALVVAFSILVETYRGRLYKLYYM